MSKYSFKNTSVARSRIMRGIRSKDTRPEILVRSAFHRAGLRFRLHSKVLPGRPDLVLASYGVIIFVHGCFWHQHARCGSKRIPQPNREYWATKLQRNVQRDLANRRALRRRGWRVITIWECEIDSRHLNALISRILRYRASLHREGTRKSGSREVSGSRRRLFHEASR